MALISILLLFFFSLLYQQQPCTYSLSNLPGRGRSPFKSNLIVHSSPTNGTGPSTFFEVNRPIELPKTKPCSVLVLQHEFGFTFGKPPVLGQYTPPSNCTTGNFSRIVLEWKATSRGIQFDRIFGVWLGGVELLRSCTAEPTEEGIIWTVEKDITRYYSLLMTNQTLAVYLGNVVDHTYTGVYHANVSIHFYPAERTQSSTDGSGHGFNDFADLILPVSRNLPLNDGLWFEIGSDNKSVSSRFIIPQNAYRAVLEVHVSFHDEDEFWYTNFQGEDSSMKYAFENGPFREVVASLDGMVVGAVWPFTVIFTGGINPSFWKPVTGIGSFDLPSYDIEITPFLGAILDGNSHEIGFSVTNGLNVWFVDANLHVWLDEKSQKTEGTIQMHQSSSVHSSLVHQDDKIVTMASRSLKSSGWVKSSYGNITSEVTQKFNYSNIMVLQDDVDLASVNQIIEFNDSVNASLPFSSVIYSMKSFKKFLIDLSADSVTNVTLGFNEVRVEESDSESSSVSSLDNWQDGRFPSNNPSGTVTAQVYDYDDGNSCYFRNVSSVNSVALYDKQSDICTSSRSRSYY